jgi:beta-fructofuranosidase
MSFTRRKFLSNLGAASVVTSVAASHESRLLSAFSSGGKSDLRARLAADPLRPQCHLLPAKNWMNDPNGPIYWNGQYHMFFQYNPNAAVWGDMHWAHAVSPDMIHWRHLPVALAPTPGWDDADGCFTGSAVNDNGTCAILYTGVKSVAPELATLRDGQHNFREVQCLATSTDPQLRTWTKWKTPVIQPPNDPQLTGFRDPFLWRERDVWYLGVGSGVRKKGGCVLLYRSKNLREWEYLHPLASGEWNGRENINLVESGEMWECPDFFRLRKKFVLLYSTAGKVIWETGELDRREMRFYRERSGLLDHGAYYAQKTQSGEPLLWGWIPETRPEAEFKEAGWAGCMALPRVLDLSPKNDLRMYVLPAAESLWARHFNTDTEEAKRSAAERVRLVENIRIDGIAGEFQWNSNSLPFGFAIEDSAGPWWSFQAESADRSSMTLRINDKNIVVPREDADAMYCHLILDASVAEFFCNRLHAVTSRIYRKPEGPLRVQLKETDAKAILSFQASQLRPISKDRLTT